MPHNLRAILLGLFFLLLAISILGGLIWADVQVSRQISGGKSFAPIWKAAQNYATFGVSPYETQTVNDIQFLLYGRPAEKGEVLTRVNVPFHTVLLFLPFGFISDFIFARALWMLLCQVLLALLIVLIFKLVAPKTSILIPASILLVAFLGAGGVHAILSGSLGIANAFLILSAMLMLYRNSDEVAGILLALATFAVEPSITLIIFILYWTYTSDRRRVWIGLIMGLIVLFAFSFLFLPSWVLGFIRTIANFLRGDSYFTIFTIIEGWIPGAGARIAWVIIAAMAILLGAEWSAARRRDQRWVLWTSALTIAVTPLLGLPILPMEYTLMLFPLAIFFAMVYERWGRSGLMLGSGVMILFFAGTWLLIAGGYSLAFPLSIFMIILLYWVRWWAVCPPRVWIDTIAGK